MYFTYHVDWRLNIHLICSIFRNLAKLQIKDLDDFLGLSVSQTNKYFIKRKHLDLPNDKMFENAIAFILFSLEWFHIWGHTLILFRIRMLPRKDLVRIRLYFLFDMFTVFCSSILFTGKLRWLAVLQMIQHSYYYIFWDKTDLAKKVYFKWWALVSRNTSYSVYMMLAPFLHMISFLAFLCIATSEINQPLLYVTVSRNSSFVQY